MGVFLHEQRCVNGLYTFRSPMLQQRYARLGSRLHLVLAPRRRGHRDRPAPGDSEGHRQRAGHSLAPGRENPEMPNTGLITFQVVEKETKAQAGQGATRCASSMRTAM